MFLFCLLFALAAANTGNNLLYLLVALLVAAYPVSALFLRMSLARLDAELLAPAEARVGQEIELAATLTSGARQGSTGLVVELAGLDVARDAQALPPEARGVAHLARGASEIVGYRATLARRGEVALLLLARCPFPFGLLEGTRVLARTTLLALPSPDPGWRVVVAPVSDEGEPRPERGQGTDIFDIRDHRPGDDARRMDWKTTARLGRPMVRDFSREEERSVAIAVDAVLVPAGIDRAAPAELAVARAAGAVEELSREGWRVALILPDGRREGDPRALLRELATLPVRKESAGDWWTAKAHARESLLVIRSVARRPEQAS